jgi:cystathionine beta-lyase
MKWTKFPDCIGAFVAEMDFGTAPGVKEALRETVDAGFFGYLPTAKAEELGVACAEWYATNTDWDVSPESIYPLPDVLKALEVTLMHFAPRGGKVIVPTPAYMPFLLVPGFHDREVIQVPLLRSENQWSYDLDGIDAAFRDGGEVLILCNPYNPIGRVMSRDELVAISEVVSRHDGRVFSDEIHAPLVFADHKHVPYASISDVTAGHTITAIAASKAWNLAGLKCAQIVLSNEEDIEIWKKEGWWAGHGASSLGVVASIAAYTTGDAWLREVLDYLDSNRRLLGELTSSLLPGVNYTMPEGTYLAWLDFRDTPLDGDLAEFFREKAHVAVVDGGACGTVGSRSIRFNFAMPGPLLEQAVRQMSEAMRAI